MKEKKTELRIFTIADWEKEERYLRKRHQEGWKFVNVSLPGLYHFVKCEPEVGADVQEGRPLNCVPPLTVMPTSVLRVMPVSVTSTLLLSPASTVTPLPLLKIP